MKKMNLLIFVLLPLVLAAQVNLKTISRKSSQSFVFAINAMDAEKFIHDDSIPVDRFINEKAAFVFPTDSINTGILPLGHYILTSVNEGKLVAELVEVSDLIAYPVNNAFNIQFNIRNKEGSDIKNAQVWINNKRVRYDQDANTYLVDRKKIKEGFVRVYTPGDTCFMRFEREENPPISAFKQRWRRLKGSKTGSVILWIPGKVSDLFNRRYRGGASSNKPGSGYVLFNQPKYKLSDTVKLKAYILNKRWKPYNKDLDVNLTYFSKGQYHSQFLKKISATSSGSYIYSFPLSDTLASDTRYYVAFNNKKGEPIIGKSFSTEDYVLDEVNSYTLRTDKEEYSKNDSLFFYASAKDANNLPLLDGEAKLVLLTQSINGFHKDAVQVPDTLYAGQKMLETDGETVFRLHTGMFPPADLTINAKLIFINSNNEIQEKSTVIDYLYTTRTITLTKNADTIVAKYEIDGKSAESNAVMHLTGELIDREVLVHLPAKIKIDPLADNYSFSICDLNDTITKSIDIDERYELVLSRLGNGDSVGFSLYNPYRVPVNFIVLDGNKVIYNGWNDKEIIAWSKALPKRKIYTIKWQYTWAGERKYGSQSIALLYKLLQVNVNNSETIFPGQKDTITIEVKDYQNRPAEGVNLAAVAYNSQFKKDIDVKEPPYLVKYRNRLNITRQRGEISGVYLYKQYPLGNHRKWIERMSLDTMRYYQALFPGKYPYDIVTRISDFTPQLAVQVVKNGVPQDVYLLYINRQLVYYKEVTSNMPYAFETFQSFSQIGIRLYDRYIEIDSIYIQPFYKHDIIVDLDSLPTKSRSNKMPAYWTSDEKRLIENSVWQFDNKTGPLPSYVWQGSKLVKIDKTGRHQLGPFNSGDSMHFYTPGVFDIHFIYEPGYEYRLTKQMARLEKKSIFPLIKGNVSLRKTENVALNLGDTIIAPIPIVYPTLVQQPYLLLTSSEKYRGHVSENGNAKLLLEVANDTILKYVVLYSEDTTLTRLVLSGDTRRINNIRPGKYSLLLVDKNFEAAELDWVEFKADNTLCLETKQIQFKERNRLLHKLLREAMDPGKKQEDVKQTDSTTRLPSYPAGSSFIIGRITDLKGGNGIPGALIKISGYDTSIFTQNDGYFSIENIKEGEYNLRVSSVGYISKLKLVNVQNTQNLVLHISLEMGSNNLEEVVVTGYAVERKRNLTGSVAIVTPGYFSKQVDNALQGKVAGVNVHQQGVLGNLAKLQIRGFINQAPENTPLYIVDGIFYDKMPSNITSGMIRNIEVLKDPDAIAIYGSRAVNGVIIITTDAKQVRNSFRDYGFWQPELFTDAEGKVSFEAIYPDNITSWEIYALGMDKKRRIGKGVGFAKAYKPVMAQLNTSQFLISGDSALFVGKLMNYTGDNYSVQTEFKINGQVINRCDSILPPKASSINYLPVKAGANVLNASFELRASTGFTDGEERKIPVLNIGSEETNGRFYVLQKDTVFDFLPVVNAGPVEIYAQNNTLDILLNELDHLKKYPYYCMEQTASKLKGLLLEQKIKELMKQPFKHERDIRGLIKKLQEGQLFEGGWGWWSNNEPNIPVTTYIIEALLLLRNDPLIEATIRNGLIYLQNQLLRAKKDQNLQILSCLSSAGHAIDYTSYLAKISFDSLTLHQQWQWVRICQQQKLAYSDQLKKLVEKKTETILGGAYWGAETYRWYDNAMATTQLAYMVLEQDKNYNYLLENIIQYFIGQRRESYWTNTVESASITAAILPRILSVNPSFNKSTSISIEGDSNLIIDSFPYAVTLSPSATGKLTIKKTGEGISYLTLHQKWWNPDPLPATSKFDIQTYFEKDGRRLRTIVSGEKVKMKVRLNVLKEAEYVVTEIPIPAGCTYSSKSQSGGEHKEFLKNKVVIFSEFLRKGEHIFEVELEPRYKGRFTVNPAKVELMYFPTFYGRNELGSVDIK